MSGWNITKQLIEPSLIAPARRPVNYRVDPRWGLSCLFAAEGADIVDVITGARRTSTTALSYRNTEYGQAVEPASVEYWELDSVIEANSPTTLIICWFGRIVPSGVFNKIGLNKAGFAVGEFQLYGQDKAVDTLGATFRYAGTVNLLHSSIDYSLFDNRINVAVLVKDGLIGHHFYLTGFDAMHETVTSVDFASNELSRLYLTNVSLDGLFYMGFARNRAYSETEANKIIEAPFSIFEQLNLFGGFTSAGAAPPVGAIMNQFQKAHLGADLFNGTLQ